jgi:hypothetical protein
VRLHKRGPTRLRRPRVRLAGGDGQHSKRQGSISGGVKKTPRLTLLNFYVYAIVARLRARCVERCGSIQGLATASIIERVLAMTVHYLFKTELEFLVWNFLGCEDFFTFRGSLKCLREEVNGRLRPI